MRKIKCKKLKKNGQKNKIIIRDSETNDFIDLAEKRSISEFKETVKNLGRNPSYLVEKLQRVKDGKIVYLWFDCETNETFISY